jgi:hypothetical protein
VGARKNFHAAPISRAQINEHLLYCPRLKFLPEKGGIDGSQEDRVEEDHQEWLEEVVEEVVPSPRLRRNRTSPGRFGRGDFVYLAGLRGALK